MPCKVHPGCFSGSCTVALLLRSQNKTFYKDTVGKPLFKKWLIFGVFFLNGGEEG